MQVSQERVVAIQLHQLILVVRININRVRNTDVFVWQDVLRMTILVAWSVEVMNLQILRLFVLINCEEEVLLRDDFLVLVGGEFLCGKLVFELKFVYFLLDDVVDFGFDLLKVMGRCMSVDCEALGVGPPQFR